jgi:hypothetical protein
VAKQKFKITKWATYNKALIHRGSLTFWLDESAIQAWYNDLNTSSRGLPQRSSVLAISTVLMLKHVFRLTLRVAQGFIDFIFTLMNSRSGARITPASAGGLSPSTSRLKPPRAAKLPIWLSTPPD